MDCTLARSSPSSRPLAFSPLGLGAITLSGERIQARSAASASAVIFVLDRAEDAEEDRKMGRRFSRALTSW